jgi:CubicO group peptidase (beta-lactamase class C family)
MRTDRTDICLLLALVVLVPMMVSGGPLAQMNKEGRREAAPARPVASPSHSFEEAFDRYVRDDSIEGAAYVVVEDGRATEWHTLGMADRDLRQTVDHETIFHWGSITKTLTAVAVMQLRDSHRISLDDSITKYVPELERIHSDYGPVSQVTLKQLLSHTAGFQGPTWPYRDETKPWQPFEPTEWAQLVAMMPYQELAFKPGSRFSYSNPAFIYLARVIEAVSGLSYQEYVKRNIMAPLGMQHSYFNLSPPSLARDRSNNYTVSIDPSGCLIKSANGREFDTGITTPNGGLNAPLGDLVRWVNFLTAAGPATSPSTGAGPAVSPSTGTNSAAPHVTGPSSVTSQLILSRDSLLEMWRPVVVVNQAPDHPQYMGLSFFLDPRTSASGTTTFVGHTGSQAGFRAFLEFNPQNRRAVIAAFNTAHADGHNEAETRAAQKSRDGYTALREQSFDLLR